MTPLYSVSWTTWDQCYQHDVDAEGVIALLEELARSQGDPPVMVEVAPHESHGQALTIGLGSPETVLTYQDSLDPPYFASLGETGGPAVMYCWGRQWSEYPGENVVSLNDGMAAVREFLTSRRRPEMLSWEQL